MLEAQATRPQAGGSVNSPSVRNAMSSRFAGSRAVLALVLVGMMAARASLAIADPDSLAASPAKPAGSPPVIAPPRLGGYIQAREVAQERVGLTAIVNRARLSVDGLLPSGFAYDAELEME